MNSSQKRFTISKDDIIAQSIFEHVATPAIHLLSSLSIVRPEPKKFDITHPISRNNTTPSTPDDEAPNTAPSPPLDPIPEDNTTHLIPPEDNPPLSHTHDPIPEDNTPYIIPPDDDPPLSHDPIDKDSPDSKCVIPSSNSSIRPPSPILPQDKVRSAEPTVKSVMLEDLRKGIGYQCTGSITPF